jgi:hypothetical protein
MNYFIFLVIFEELLDLAMWLKLPKKIKIVLFLKENLHMVLHDVIFNMTTWI